MKFHRALSYLSLAAAALLAGPLHAATVTTPAAGDIFLGVRASGGQGSGTSLIVNVGSDSAFRTATAGTTLPLGNVSADLVATYGAGWATRSDLNWGFFGSRNQANPVVYASRAQSPFGSSAAAYPALTVDSRAATNTQIISVIDAYSSLDASASGPKAALQSNKANASSYNYQVATEGTTDFGSLSRWTTIEGNFALGADNTALDLFRLAGTTSDTVERLGSFSITSDGALSFLAGPVIDLVRVASVATTVQEDAGTVTVIFQRLGDHNGSPISATFGISNGTAQAGVDFTTPASLTVNFAANESNASVVIPVANRTGFHGNRSFTLTLANATGGYVIGSAASTVVTITDVDPDPGALAFTAASFTASVLDSSVLVTLERTGGSAGAVAADVSVTGGTLANGSAYSFTSPTTVSFADGATSASTTINLSTPVAGTIILGLSNPTGFARVGAQASTTVTVAGAPGTLAFGAVKYSFNESTGTVNIPVVRTAGLQGQVTVKVNSHSGTAQSPSDFQAVTDYTATLNEGVSSVNVPVTLFNTQTGETNETFTLTLTDATGGASLGAITTTTVRILELDSKIPTVVLTTPAANARILATAGPTVAVTGTAGDDKGLDRVEIQLNGGSWTAATLTPNATATTATFSRTVTPVPGSNTLNVRSVDGIGNLSNVVTRTFTYVVLSPLTVNIDAASPASSGTLPAPFPGTDANREVGKTYTLVAKPAKNFVFDHWSGTGISGPLAELPSLTFVHSANLVLTAKFVANPFATGVIGDFNGLVTATGAVTPSQSSNGFINVKVTGTGSFTGTLKIDGLSLPLAGAFNNSGIARFGATRSSTLLVPRPSKPSYVLALNLDLDATVNGTNKITGTLGEQDRTTVKPLSVVNADRARYTATDKAPAASQGSYNVIIPAQPQVGSVLTTSDYPQGDGIGTITVTPAGVATLAGTLADGTVVTANAPLSKTATVPLFAQLYTAKGGSFGGEIKLDAGQANSDLAVTAGTDFHWFRPYQAGQYYPFGWLEGVTTGFIGAKYAAPVNASAVPGVQPVADVTLANATLVLADGKLGASITKDVNISTKDVVTKIPPTDPSFTLTVTPKTGDVSGTFVHSDGTKPAFKAKIVQKGTSAGAYGFFLTTAPKTVDGTGESGGVSLNHK